ncbi:FMN-binding protein [Terrilactibacillus sp. S3-3]|nr:FMN-binding protein [Terrilactibacillus sp. S3-3]
MHGNNWFSLYGRLCCNGAKSRGNDSIAKTGKAAAEFGSSTGFKKSPDFCATKHTQKTDKQTGYQDGTYSGQGTNHFGTVAVSVTIKQGKIASVEITNCTTSYSQSYIDHLPSEVVARQSANVDNVSGATNSTEDFKTAIMDAISKAKIS